MLKRSSHTESARSFWIPAMPGHLIRPLSGRMRPDTLPGGRAEREKLNDLLVKQRYHHRNDDPFLILPVLSANLAAMKI